MTNAEKYLKDNVSAEEFARKIDQYCYDNETPDEDTGLDTEELIIMFMKEQVKPTLTEDERVILRNIKNEEYNGIIGRADDTTYQVGKLYLKSKYSGAKAFAFSTLYNHLFQFIKERRRILY